MSNPPSADHPGYRTQRTLVSKTPRMAKALKRGKRKKQKLLDDAVAKAKAKQHHGLGLDLSKISMEEYAQAVERDAAKIGHEKRIARAKERMAKTGKFPQT